MSDDFAPGAEEPAKPTDTGQPSPADSAPKPPEGDGPATRSMTWVWILLGVLAVVAIGWIVLSGQDVAVPDVVGLSQEQATVVLANAGLKVGRVTDEPTLETEPGTVVSQSPPADEKAPEGSAVDISVSSIPKAEVPDVVGKTQSEAVALLAEAGLLPGNLDFEDSADVEAGYVISQDPESGAEVTIGTPVALVTSLGEPAAEEPAAEEPAVEEPPAEEPPTTDEPATEEPAPEEPTAKVPDVVGLSEADAESTLKGADLKSDSRKAESKDVPAGDVISQSPKAGTVMATGSTVEITVSKGAAEDPKATVPDVVGMGVLQSIQALVGADLKFAIEFGPATDDYFKVAAQDPAAGSQVDPGTKVTLTVGLPDIASILEGLMGGEQPVTLPAESPESEVTTP